MQDNLSKTNAHVDGLSLPKPVASIVLTTAVLINTLSFAASQLWVSPDASYYVELAGGLADRLDLRSQLFLIRPPGYPIFLAGLFRVFGAASPTAIMVCQHLMVVAVAYLIALIAWRITRHSWSAALAGLMTACSLQLVSYANLIMTEVPFTLITVWAIYHLVAFHQTARCHHLALASLLTGLSYTFRPIGMALLPLCPLVALYAAFRSARKSICATALEQCQPSFTVLASRRFGVSAFWATAPAFAIYLPCLLQNQLAHGGDLSSRCADLALYFRIAYMDKLDSTDSAALNDIRAVVAEAREKKLIPENADYRLWGSVWQAYEKTRGIQLAGSSRIMGRAARDLIAEHPLDVLDTSIRYALWMILVPDGFYRFHPGGAPGITTPEGERKRDPNAAILACDTYEPMMRQWTRPYMHYLPLRADATALTPYWSGMSRWFYEKIEKGPSILGIGDTPYEFFGWLCLGGTCISLLMPQRGTWLIVIAAIGLPVVISAFLAGPTPRYAVPLRPLLVLFPTIPFVVATSCFRRLAVYLRSSALICGLFPTTASQPPQPCPR